MTSIAWKDGFLAADTAVWSMADDHIIVGYVNKIRRLRDGRLFAACGESPVVHACAAWLNGDGSKPTPVGGDSFGGVILSHNRIEKVSASFDMYETANDFGVEGCHMGLMMGAMLAGASAEEAVRLAVCYGSLAAGEVQVERL